MTVRRLVEQLKALGVREGGVLLVHTSFRAVRPVEGGPLGLIGALRQALGHEGTLVMPAMTRARVPYTVSHPCVIEVDGVARTVMVRETDHCCAGFQLADEWLRARGLQREGKVGNADARLSEACNLVEVAVEHLALNSLVFLCSRGVDAASATQPVRTSGVRIPLTIHQGL